MDPPRLQLVEERLGHRALAGTREPGQPDREARVAHLPRYALAWAGSKRSAASTFWMKSKSFWRNGSSSPGYHTGLAITRPRQAMKGAATSRSSVSPEASR